MGSRRILGDDTAWELLAGAREVRVAAVVDGRPLLRTMHAAAIDGALVLHGAPRSEKAGWVGAEVVVAAEEVIARIPSWMRHPERACPATTLYRSVQARGRVEAVEDPDFRARALQALMEKLQPEGGYRPLDAGDPLYRAAVRGLGIWVVRLEAVSGVCKPGDHFTDAEVRGVLAGLWARGGPGDLAAIETISDAHPSGATFVDLPRGLRPRCHPSVADADAAAALVADAYWNADFPVEVLAEAVRESTAWVGIQDAGRLVATARAISDRAKRSWIYDVAVAPDRRGRGLGTLLMRTLLDHPGVRHTQVSLGTRDAMTFYEALGFERLVTHHRGTQPTTQMIRASRTRSPGPGR